MEDPNKIEATGGPPIRPPDPAPEPPLPPEPAKGGLTPFGALGILAAVAGGLFVLVQATSTRTLGATRSYRLKCEERQQQIEAVVQEDSVAAPRAGQPAE